jgi:uncharacterized phage infection (PIP) family protein YhgE
MATNTIDTAADRPLAEEIFRLQRLEREAGPKNGTDNGAVEASPGGRDSGEGLALAPLVDKIAYGIARGLVVAMKELENHIASETRKVGDSVSRRLDTLQASVQDLTVAVSEQRAFSTSIQDQCKELAAGAASLKETDARQDVELESLRTGAKETSAAISARIDANTASLTEVDRRQDVELESLRTGAKETSAAISARIDAATAALTEADRRQDVELESLRTGTKETAAAISARIDVATASLTEADARQDAKLESLRTESKATSAAISARIDAATASLTEADARQDVELESLRTATKETSAVITARIDALCKDLCVQQEDIAAVKSTLCSFSSTVEGLVERLDRQADALRTMCAAYAQRETELGTLVDGLARLRAYPAPAPTDRL